MIKKTNPIYLLTLAIILFPICELSAQYDKINPRKFKDQLEEGSKLIGSGEDMTIEKTVDKTYIFKYYNPTTKQLLERITYFDKELTIKEGPAAKYNNEGGVILQGSYVGDYRDGLWVENFNIGQPKARGSYDKGNKIGKWEYFNFNGELSKEEVWENGDLVIENIFAPADEDSYVYDMSDTLLNSKPSFVRCNEGKGEAADFQCAQIKMLEYIYKNIRYPADARNNGYQGTCVISFIVEKDGAISFPEVVRSVCTSIDEESLRVVKSMRAWVPGEIDGKPVRVRYDMPIRYKLE